MRMLLLACCLAASAQQRPAASDFPALMDGGLAAFQRGEFAPAEGLFRSAAARQPGSFDAHFLLGATLVELGRNREAVGELRTAVKLNPRHADARKLLAAQCMIVRDYASAIALLVKVPALDEEMHLLLIEAYQTSGDTAASLALALKAVARFPASPQVNCWMGFEMQFSGRYEEAKKYLEKALRLDPGYPATYYLLADILLKEERYPEAVERFRAAIRMDSDDMDARLGLAQALLGMEDYPQARQTLEEAVGAAPENSKAHLLLSRLYYRTGDEERADREAQLAVRLRSRETSPTAAPAALQRR